MLYRISREPTAWDRSAVWIAGMVAAQIAFAWLLVVHPARLGGTTLIVLPALAIVSVVVLVRSRMPAPIKAALSFALVAAVLAAGATQNALVVRRAQADVGAEIAESAVPRDNGVLVSAEAGDGSSGGRTAAELQDALASRGVSGDVKVSLEPIERTFDPERPLRFHWTLERGGERVWCGDYTVADRRRPDIGLLTDRVSDAIARSQGGPLACE